LREAGKANALVGRKIGHRDARKIFPPPPDVNRKSELERHPKPNDGLLSNPAINSDETPREVFSRAKTSLRICGRLSEKLLLTFYFHRRMFSPFLRSSWLTG
jgi:hypothetical protein